jgi:nicotinate-nucleotide adenylyltransferase
MRQREEVQEVPRGGGLKLGVFGGTFDPPHVGHLVAAQEVHHRLGLDRLLLLPAAVPPHKLDRTVTPGPLRLEMLSAAVDGDERFEVSDLELRRSGPSYTIDTLRELRLRSPEASLYLAIGADQVAELDTWREASAIGELATVVAFARGGQAVAPPADGLPRGLAGAIRTIDVPSLEISSTAIRARVAAGEPIAYLVPEPVQAIIRREGLYRGR